MIPIICVIVGILICGFSATYALGAYLDGDLFSASMSIVFVFIGITVLCVGKHYVPSADYSAGKQYVISRAITPNDAREYFLKCVDQPKQVGAISNAREWVKGCVAGAKEFGVEFNSDKFLISQ